MDLFRPVKKSTYSLSFSCHMSGFVNLTSFFIVKSEKIYKLLQFGLRMFL